MEGYPQENQWREIDDEPQQQPAQDADAKEWQELGDETEAQPEHHHHHHSHPVENADENEPIIPAESQEDEDAGAAEHHPHHHVENPEENAEAEETPYGQIEGEVQAEEERPRHTEDQYAEIGDEHAGDRQEERAEDEEGAPDQNQYAEIGDAGAHQRHVAEEVHHEKDQWAEIDDENAAKQAEAEPAEAEENAEEGNEEQYVQDAQDANDAEVEEGEVAPRLNAVEEEPANQWAELGDGHEPHHEQPVHSHENQGHHQLVAEETADPAAGKQRGRLTSLQKPRRRTSVKVPVAWSDLPLTQLQPDDDDEFDLRTAKNPVYDQPEPTHTHVFKNGEPDAVGEIMSCFEDPNLLYRIINKQEKTWAFYNDSCTYEIHVQFTYGKHSKIQPLENTTMEKNENGEFVCQVVVYPTETEMFISGTVNGFTSKLRAVPLSDNYFIEHQTFAFDEVTKKEIDAIRAVAGDETNSEKILQICLDNDLKFVDLEFPPSQSSLDTGSKKAFPHFPWARPSMYLPEDLKDQVRLFRHNIFPGDVDQGDLGDCWVLCAIAAVCESPDRIFNMFRHPTDPQLGKRERALGAYRVTFNKNGIWRSVIVDDYFPVIGGRPKYAKSNEDLCEIWPSIAEKAFAKLHNSYANICAGDPLYALQDMTGFPTTRFDDWLIGASKGNDVDQFFRRLQRFDEAGFQIVASTPGKDTFASINLGEKNDPALEAEYKARGLVLGHAYTLLSVFEFPEHSLRLVKIRNTWGRGMEWTGDWCDSDPRWKEYPDVAEATKFTAAEDGIFFMSLDNCLRYFNGGGACFTRDGSYDYRVPVTFTGDVPSVVLEVTVTEPTRVCFILSQTDKRGNPNAGPYSAVMLSIATEDESGLYSIIKNSSPNALEPAVDKWTFLQARDISIIHEFEPSKSAQIVVPRIMHVNGQPDHDVSVSLGIISGTPLGQGVIDVKFAQIQPENKVLMNFPKFEPEFTPTEARYQSKGPTVGHPVEKSGPSIE